MTISKDLLDQLLDGVQNADDLLGEHGLMKDLKARLMERMLGAELTAHPLPGRRLQGNLPGGLATSHMANHPANKATGVMAPHAWRRRNQVDLSGNPQI